MEATTVIGIYVDGDRELTPYEADAYINQLSFYACDLDPRVARSTFDFLLQYPTWPTEWSFHVPMIAAEDYLATGDLEMARDNWDALKAKLLMTRRARMVCCAPKQLWIGRWAIATVTTEAKNSRRPRPSRAAGIQHRCERILLSRAATDGAARARFEKRKRRGRT